ncbi:MAG: HDIG domain-containing protein [Anaerolineae bacterium]|jgi:putative nucleotidyltransferase with HDIG domain|nr:HDIG domain-containing protein [Anaerolineae bacterium]MDH7473322.1 HDIG domain-containing protein [Anaerolineae bacterium]
MQPTRDDAWNLLNEYTKNPNLIKHALAVEAAMRAYARRFGEDEELWGIVGLVHDFDYEQHPTAEEHPFAGAEILRQRSWPEGIVRAVLSHARYSGVNRDSLLEKTLFAVDELTGLIVAVALVRPSKSILDVEVKSVRKKWKDKSFAAGASREDIEQGAAELGVELNEHIGVVLEAMKGIADELGLRGTV